MMDNYISIPKEERDKPIYRVISISRLLEMFAIKKNTLLKPKLWDDPFENFICKSTFQDENGKTHKYPFRNRAYGQCWTLKNESDAMWRIYAPNKDGVKIETSIRSLFDSLWDDNRYHKSLPSPLKYPQSSCFIGKVEYHKQEALKDLIGDPNKMFELMKGNNRQSEGHAKTLLLKREEFDHEYEVRLIYFNHREDGDDIHQYPCDPYELISRITFDPRMETRLFDVYKMFFKNSGYKGEVEQSTLYSIPQLKVAYKP